jgi:AcrR family transcriptional regulator
MADSPGRREQHKQQTRGALQAAADRLFAERGYKETTVRDIAEAAGVTERTFFRYFSAKEELALPGAMTWLRSMGAAIVARPADEDAVTAVREVVLATEAAMRSSSGPTLLSLYADRVPAEVVRPDPARQARFLAVEGALAEAVRERLLVDGVPDDELLDYRAAALARVCVALVRSALLHDLARRRSREGGGGSLRELLEIGFTDLRDGWRVPSADHSPPR